MSIQELLAQIQGMGIGVEGSNMAGLTQEQIQTGIGGQYSSDVQAMLKPEMFQTLSPELLRSGSISAYSPMFQQKQQNMLGQLMSSMQGKKVQQSMGGLAGTGATQFAQSQAKDVYGKGMQNVFTQAQAGKTESLKSLQAIIDNWKETAQSFTSAG